MESEHLLVKKDGSILSLTLNRPESLNAFSPEMVLGLTRSIQATKEDDDVRVVVISGAGRSFTAGGDVKTMGQASPVETYDHIGKLNELILTMKELEKPIIAAVHGFAAGAGFNLALACDLIVAAEDSKFALSFSQVGLISDGGGLYFLPRMIGPYRAKELFFSGEPITAQQAFDYGIVNRLFPLGELQEGTLNYANQLAKGPSKAFGKIKRIADQSFTSTLPEILEQERLTQAMMVTTEDHREGVQAFKEKRRPVFKGN